MVLLYYLCLCSVLVVFFFFKQKTAYEVRISDWSSDVCSSDLNRYAVDVEIQEQHDIFFRDRITKIACHFVDLRSFGQKKSPEIKIGRASCRERVCQYV